ncbi:MAG TPA: AMP-binding protein [Bacteriovoracaceae bacterium]|nr:AMP-binding protein [Bacteriovoracaceae bacterium]
MFNLKLGREELQVNCHPQYQVEGQRISRELKDYDLANHYLLFSSGTTGHYLKGYALSQKALMANAKAVNEHFQLTSKDVWGLSLPVYHVGGFSVLMRAQLLGNNIVDCRQLDSLQWLDKIKEVTISTIVPTQLHDLVMMKLEAPSKLKYLIVGGDLLSSELKQMAMDLGWPVIRTFGMTEVCSQLASASTVDSDILHVLPIHRAKINQENRLLVKSPALFTLQFLQEEKLKIQTVADLSDQDGYYVTNDRVKLNNNIILPMGRFDAQYKISGHLVNFNYLRDAFYTFQLQHGHSGKMEFVLEEDVRKGKKLVLLHLRNALDKEILAAIGALILPVKIDEVREVKEFKRTELGKLRG